MAPGSRAIRKSTVEISVIIARAARVNKALLYYYFKDKEALYQAVLDQPGMGFECKRDFSSATPNFFNYRKVQNHGEG